MTRAVGICIGASTITAARRTEGGFCFTRQPHNGEIGSRLERLLKEQAGTRLGVTGSKFRQLLSIPTLSEPEAVERAYAHLRHRYPATDCIVSAGGEMFIAYGLDSRGRIRTVHTGNKCAAGTGEFFLQQIRRMGLGIEPALELAAASPPYTVAGRCSVFCKSDCTHALNKGVAKGEVVAGLCRMMAGKIVELLQKAKAGRVALVGGVSMNKVVLEILQQSWPDLYAPEEAGGFEALGALLWAEKEGVRAGDSRRLFVSAPRSFGRLPAVGEGLPLVSFKSASAGTFYAGDYLVGLDVGSTTTKAVLMRADSRAVVASSYLRTDGDPVEASRQCYRQLAAQLPAGLVPTIVGLGVTGSGRQIAGLHALTPGVINEIVAHAAAAVHFDPDVDTIFEIGGQDAKYTWLTHRIACDYAMNEACSAGTGSFLEEACLESLGIATSDIAPMALQASAPPNFNDQCSAFIGSDIKTALQEGVAREEIAAGLVFSVCQNYLNRVKGNRPVGRKIFMQGGVCYNRAVPAAMAVLCGQPIVVPPEPGLMGAFGAALEVARKIETGLLSRQSFSLQELAGREVGYLAPFTCGGGPQGCDRKCSITRVVLDGRTYPFGGACSRYDRRHGEGPAAGGENLVGQRHDLIFASPPAAVPPAGRTVGLLPSLFGSSLHPLYATFFQHLGLQVVTAATAQPEGMEMTGASFCHPVVQSHGFIRDLLQRSVDLIFVPHVRNAVLTGREEEGCTCPLVQAEPYYLKAAFHDELTPKLLTLIVDGADRPRLRQQFIQLGRRLGAAPAQAGEAFDRGWRALATVQQQMLSRGRQFLQTLPPQETAIVLFGRPYNAFSPYANLGIPHKFASRGYRIIPHDWLPAGEREGRWEPMYWNSGRQILQSAGLVSRQPNLFGVYVTSFSCGPDSFLIGYFRDLMGQKPSLVLELDAHAADAGIDTRIDAFLDVIRGYREIAPQTAPPPLFPVTRLQAQQGELRVRSGAGRQIRLTDPAVKVLIPSMGDIGAEAMAAAFRYGGIQAVAAPPPGPQELELGKEIASCKECLPLLLTAGSLRRYLQEAHRPGEILLYFMPSAPGPCRQGQYRVFLEGYLEKERIGDVGLLSLDCKDSYAGLSSRLTRRGWQAICISDGLEEIRAAIRALACDPQAALQAFEQARRSIVESLESAPLKDLLAVLGEEMRRLGRLERSCSLAEATRVSLVGEIYVRRDGFSRQYLAEKLAARQVVVRTSPVNEWLHYTDYFITQGFDPRTTLGEKLAVRMKQAIKRRDEASIRQALLLSGFYQPTEVPVQELVSRGGKLIDPLLDTEAILTTGAALMEIGDETHGVISIGPFGCLPGRISEAILNCRLEAEKPNFSLHDGPFWREAGRELALPFLAIETDGNAFPPVVEARLENFIRAAHRLREQLQARHPAAQRQRSTRADKMPEATPEGLRPKTESAG